MTGFAFDPWAYLKSRERPPPAAKAANLLIQLRPTPSGLAALAALAEGCLQTLESATSRTLRPGVPLDWCEGVARLATLPAPDSITPPRWCMFQATAARVLHDHGAKLHAAGWDGLDLFGLHQAAPATYPPGWGLAWLLGDHGEVLDVLPEEVGLRRAPDGARLAFRRRGVMTRAGGVAAWNL